MDKYTSAEHAANLDKWMDATDKERSEAFYVLLAICGARAEIGDVNMGERLRALVMRLQAGELP